MRIGDFDTAKVFSHIPEKNPLEGKPYSVEYLDLKNCRLMGFEQSKNAQKIESIIAGIEAEDDFPPVVVMRGEDNKFYLLSLDQNSLVTQ